jgi:hypothetical protein
VICLAFLSNTVAAHIFIFHRLFYLHAWGHLYRYIYPIECVCTDGHLYVILPSISDSAGLELTLHTWSESVHMMKGHHQLSQTLKSEPDI